MNASLATPQYGFVKALKIFGNAGYNTTQKELVNEQSPKLSAKRADLFHQMVAKILYVSHRAQPDVAVTTAFLYSRVNSPTEEDYKKLGRLIGYLRDSIELPLVLGSDGRDTLTWNIDTSYAVHPDCKSHTGAAITLGHGTFMPMSSKQKVVSRSSTEAKLIGISDALTFVMWAKLFFLNQMKNISKDSILKNLGKNVVYEQDNTSAILLQRNGKRSSTRRKKHIDCQYFYVTDQIKNGDVTVVHKLTEEMRSDFHTKGLVQWASNITTGQNYMQNLRRSNKENPKPYYVIYYHATPWQPMPGGVCWK